MRLPAWLGLAGFERGLASTARLPTAYLVLAVAIGGCAEEWLYRAYAFERASALLGSEWLGGALVVTAFGVAHVPIWGVGPSLTTLISGAILTVGYAWERDLAAVVIAHVATDFVGLVAGTRFSASTRAHS
jgi:membrane protease YdiL (CAAX protease family)